jgi:N-acetylneuraminic acid mutarotase
MHHFQPVIYNNEIYVAGAMTGKYPGETPLPHIYIYNAQKDEWRKGPPIPEDRNRGGAGAIIHNQFLYLVCGIKDGHRGDHKKWLDRYNFNTENWEILEDAPRPRDHFQASVVNDQIYAIAGRTTIAADSPFKNTIAQVDVYSIETDTWKTLNQTIPTQRAGNFNTVINNDILVLGGESYEQEKAHQEVEVLNVETNTWRSIAPIPVGRHGTGAVLTQYNMIYIASGSGNHGGGPELSDLWIYQF